MCIWIFVFSNEIVLCDAATHVAEATVPIFLGTFVPRVCKHGASRAVAETQGQGSFSSLSLSLSLSL